MASHRHRRPHAVALVAALVLLTPVAAQQACPFRVVAHPADDALSAAAAPALAATWTFAKELLGEPRDEVPEMIVHTYRDRDDYIAAAEAVDGPDPRVFPGFARYHDRSALLYVGPEPLDEQGLTATTRAGLVHETMHLATQAIAGRSFLFEKRWYIEGLAMWAEDSLGGDATNDDDADGDDLRGLYSAARARTLLKDGRVQPAERILLGDNGDLSQVDEYPVHRVLFGLLMEAHGPAMRKFLAATRAVPSSPALPQQQLDLLRVSLGDEAWRGLDEALRERILAAAAKAPEVDAGPPEDLHGAPGDNDFHPGSPQVAWAGTHERSSLSMTAQVTLRRAGCDQTDFVFGQDGESWLRVSIVPGRVVVLARTQQGDAPGGWQVLARSKPLDKVVTGTPFALDVQASSSTITVKVDGKVVTRTATGKRPIRGRWGMGGPAGCRATWRELRLR